MEFIRKHVTLRCRSASQITNELYFVNTFHIDKCCAAKMESFNLKSVNI